MIKRGSKAPTQLPQQLQRLTDGLTSHMTALRDGLTNHMTALSARQLQTARNYSTLREKLRGRFEDMKQVLEDDLRLTLTQLDLEQRAAEKMAEERVEECCHLKEELDQEVANISPQSAAIKERILEVLNRTDLDQLQSDHFRDEQLLSLAVNLLVFIRSQVPLARKLLQSYAANVVLDADTAHPKLTVSPEGDLVSYTDTWKDVPETPARFDTTLNVISRHGFSEGRHYWEVDVSCKTYWEIGLTYPSIPRKGRDEDCWLGRGKESWCVEYLDGDYTAWHGGVAHQLPAVAGRRFTRIGVYCSFAGGSVLFLGADAKTLTPLHCFCAGAFAERLHQAVCPGHHHQGTNWKPLQICDASRPAPHHLKSGRGKRI